MRGRARLIRLCRRIDLIRVVYGPCAGLAAASSLYPIPFDTLACLTLAAARRHLRHALPSSPTHSEVSLPGWEISHGLVRQLKATCSDPCSEQSDEIRDDRAGRGNTAAAYLLRRAGGCAHDRLILCHVASRCSSTPSTSTRGVNQPGYIPSTAAYSAHESRDADGITVSMYCRITSSSQSHGKAPCGRT
jgi:hypothetical protein